MKETMRIITSQISNLFGTFFWDDMDVLSVLAQRIFAHKEDRKKYTDAVERLRNGSEEETITLHTGESITLI